MKTKFSSILFVAALAFAGCTSDDSSNKDGKDNSDGLVTRYLTVNIVSAPSAPGVRSTLEGDPEVDNIKAQYEDGVDNENAVAKVRFYFFKDNGNAAVVKKNDNTFKSYYDFTVGNGDSDLQNNDANLEKIIKATLVINTQEGDKEAPAKIFAVLNPDAASLGTDNLSLTELRDKVDNYANKITDKTSSSFVMTNSAYLDAEGNEVYATPIEGKHLCTSADAAKATPVVMYVERNVAKVKLNSNVLAVDNHIPLKDKDGNDITVNYDGTNTSQIYLQTTGWNLTAYTNNGYLGKHIKGTWTDTNIFTSWNWYPYYRSFWGYNPNYAGQEYISYTNIGSTYRVNLNSIYTNENAGQNSTNAKQREFPTQFIIAGVLKYKDASNNYQTLSYAEYAGKKIVGETALIADMVNYVTLYKKTTNADNTNSYTKIEPNDVKLVTATVAKTLPQKQGEKDGERCFVYLALKDGDTNEWHASNIDDATSNPVLHPQAVTDALQAVGHAKFWNGGKTYYYGNIRHINNTPDGVGYDGVVRNHIYSITVTGITGLGTPVYDPSETIYPEKPKDEDTYIAAQVNILSWRLVSSNVQLSW